MWCQYCRRDHKNFSFLGKNTKGHYVFFCNKCKKIISRDLIENNVKLDNKTLLVSVSCPNCHSTIKKIVVIK